jgi:molecular chaperone GrpE
VTEPDGEITLAALSDRLDSLTDLFRRRLLDDRAKQAIIESLQSRLEQAELALAVESVRPLVTRLALVIERLQSAPATEDLRASIVEELEDVLDLVGVTTIGSSDEVDPRRHEIISVTGDGAWLRVDEVVRVGYEKGGVVLRPARVTAVRVGADGPGSSA